MKLIQLTNTELGQTEMYEVNAETFSHIWDMVNNAHNRIPTKVPEMVSDKLAVSSKARSTPHAPDTTSEPIQARPEPDSVPDPQPRPAPATPPTKYSEKYPREITLRFPGRCHKCEIRMEKGEPAMHVSKGKIEHIGDCPSGNAKLVPETPVKPPRQTTAPLNGNAAFMDSLAHLMARQ